MGQAKQILTEAGLADSHWGERIIEAEGRGRFTDDNCEDANCWVTCACGRVAANIPRDFHDAPKDEWLNSFGRRFHECVRDNDFADAARTLIAIEQRAAVVAGGAA